MDPSATRSGRGEFAAAAREAIKQYQAAGPQGLLTDATLLIKFRADERLVLSAQEKKADEDAVKAGRRP